MPPIYERIEQLCKQKGINITFLCNKCDIKRASLSDYKSGKKKSLSVETLTKIANYFDVSVDFLCGNAASADSQEALKVALFGGGSIVTDEMWDEVKRFAEFIKERENGNK